ncbi:hypothetical protein [Winogradskyella sp. 3972H.M.0a.05]|uniref:hypothetical protein n=1 Tax=Winogradskyella sp. 3972H.M.0a.05 TaxID=2950277 RepID=UPI00339A626F
MKEKDLRRILSKAIKLFNLTLILSISISCSNDGLNEDETLNLKEDFNGFMSKFNYSESYGEPVLGLFERLDHDNSYEEAIFELILQKKNSNNLPISDDINKVDEFNQYFVNEIMVALLQDGINDYFNKLEYYQLFVNSNIEDLSRKKYLNTTIEQFKWVKFSVYYKQTSQEGISFRDFDPEDYNSFDPCFDDCMEYKIDESLQNVVDWAWFLANPGSNVAQWASSCAWDCF